MSCGHEQADLYEAEMRSVFRLLSTHPEVARERVEFSPPVRIHHHARHLIVYRIEQDGLIVIRVLRDTMDLARHLTEPPDRDFTPDLS